jgi:hypothetical protein
MTRQWEKRGEGDQTREKEKVADDAMMVLSEKGGDGENGGGERKHR